jgi:hypothetical protein
MRPLEDSLVLEDPLDPEVAVDAAMRELDLDVRGVPKLKVLKVYPVKAGI